MATVERSAKYIQKGLTVVSADTSIHPRDEAGNIILHENSEENPLLIIEPNTVRITTNSILKVLNTTFEYFRFPVQSTITPVLNLDLNLTGSVATLPDLIYARYKPSEDFTPNFNEDFTPTGILMDLVEDGLPQSETNKYKVSKDIKSTASDLRIRAQVDHTTPIGGTIYFYVAKNGPIEKDLNWRGPFTSGDGTIAPNQTQRVFIDFVVPNNEIQIGDMYQIVAVTGQSEHVINAGQTYFVVTDASKNVDTWNQPIG
jgi:hypothetical protein